MKTQINWPIYGTIFRIAVQCPITTNYQAPGYTSVQLHFRLKKRNVLCSLIVG
jgi:hypothetical protein